MLKVQTPDWTRLDWSHLAGRFVVVLSSLTEPDLGRALVSYNVIQCYIVLY